MMIQNRYIVPKPTAATDVLATLVRWAEAAGLASSFQITRANEFVFFKPELSDPYRFLLTEKRTHYLLRRVS